MFLASYTASTLKTLYSLTNFSTYEKSEFWLINDDYFLDLKEENPLFAFGFLYTDLDPSIGRIDALHYSYFYDEANEYPDLEKD